MGAHVSASPSQQTLRQTSLADRFYRLPGCVESYAADGSQLMAGIMLNNAFNGTGYSAHIRMMGDFDSDLYIITSQHLTEDQDLAHT